MKSVTTLPPRTHVCLPVLERCGREHIRSAGTGTASKHIHLLFGLDVRTTVPLTNTNRPTSLRTADGELPEVRALACLRSGVRAYSARMLEMLERHISGKIA